MLDKGRATGISPVVGGWPKQQFSAAHERDCQLALSNRLDACLPQRVIPVEED
jgi:hypothetical protein